MIMKKHQIRIAKHKVMIPFIRCDFRESQKDKYPACVAAYIREFDKMNQLVPVAYAVRGIKLL